MSRLLTFVLMWAVILLGVALVWFAFSPQAQAATQGALAPGDRVPNFLLLDHQGDAHELYYHTHVDAVVLMVQGNGCPIVRHALPRLQELQQQYAEQGVAFLLINSNPQDDRARVQAEAREFGIEIPVLLDDAQLVGQAMGFERTAEVFVIDTDGWRLRYRGALDDRVSYETQRPQAVNHYLVDALDAMLAGDPIARQQTEAEGCLVHFPKRELAPEDISYAEHIGPLIADNCVACHRPGGIGPFAFDDYRMVHGFAPMIREVVMTRRMPPWQADPHYGAFEEDNSLSRSEKQMLVDWIQAGARRGEGEDPLPAAVAQEWPEWPLGEPDLIVELPPFDVPATGVIAYQHPRVANPLDEDVWIRAVDFIPGDRAVVHHIIATLTGQEGQFGRLGILGDGLGGYVPGAQPVVFPENTGVFLRKNAEFLLQMHYTTSGRATTDVTRMGLYFADEPPQHELQSMTLLDPRIRIPAGERAHTESVRRTFQRDALIYNLLPHAHFRGRASEFRLITPDGNEEVLLSVPHYDFNWQHTYNLVEPKFVPAGSTIVHSTTWDNSPQNRANPDPDVEVRWGLQSWDEMLFGSIRYRYVDDPAEAGPELAREH